MHAHFAAGLAVLSLAASPALAQQDGPPPAQVRTVQAEMRDVSPTIRVPATIASRHHSRVAAERSGRVTYVVEAGESVEVGEALARLDDAEAALRLSAAQARARRLDVQLAQQSRDVERRRDLTVRGTLPESQLDETETQRDMTAQDLREARIAVDQAEVDLARMTVTAPFSGLVAERLIEVGEYSTPGREIARLIDLSALEARANAPVAAARFLSEGMLLNVESDDGVVTAPVRAIISAGDAITRTFGLRVDLEDSPWLVGSPVRLSVPTGAPRQAVTAPRDALVLRSGGAHIMVVDAEDVAHKVDVVAGAGAGDWIEVSPAVEEGDRIVVRGAENLRDGQSVVELGEASAAVSASSDADAS